MNSAEPNYFFLSSVIMEIIINMNHLKMKYLQRKTCLKEEEEEKNMGEIGSLHSFAAV